jgi:hypothetical protein
LVSTHPEAAWHRHVQRAAVELRQARIQAAEAAIPPVTLAGVFEAELALVETKVARQQVR